MRYKYQMKNIALKKKIEMLTWQVTEINKLKIKLDKTKVTKVCN